MKHEDDFYEAGLQAWNILSVIFEGSTESFQSKEDFIKFYDIVIDKLLSEEEQE